MDRESAHWKAAERIANAYLIPSIKIRKLATSQEQPRRRWLREAFARLRGKFEEGRCPKDSK